MMGKGDWSVTAGAQENDTCLMCGATGFQHHAGCVNFRAEVWTYPIDHVIQPPTKLPGRNPKFKSQLQRMAELHDKKNHDYAQVNNPYSNFEEAAASAGVTVEQVFLTLIGVKLARLKELTTANKTPNNESIQDTRMDLAMYAALLASYFNED